MKSLFNEKLIGIHNLIIGKHPFNTVFSYNWIYVHNIVKWFRHYNQLFEGKTIVDYGAGNAPYFSIIENNVKEYYALDFYNDPIKKNKLTQISLGLDGIIPQNPDLSADVIISNQVILEIEDQKLYFDEIFKISKIGTKLFLTTPFIQTLGFNDKLRVSPYYIKKHLDRIGYEIIDYKTAGYFFSGMALSFNMCLIQKNKYDLKSEKSEYSVMNSIIFTPVIFIVNVIGTLLDRVFPLYRMPSNFLIIAEKRRNKNGEIL